VPTRKPVPEAKTEEMCTGPCPVFVTVEVSGVVLPTFTLPNARAAGVKVKCPTGTLVPVPLRLTSAGDAGSLLVMVILPLSVSAAVGA